jgi:hypothetical protein
MTEPEDPGKPRPEEAAEEETYVVEGKKQGRKVTREERDEIVAKRVNEGWTLSRMAVVEGDPEKPTRKAEVLAFEKPESPRRQEEGKKPG